MKGKKEFTPKRKVLRVEHHLCEYIGVYSDSLILFYIIIMLHHRQTEHDVCALHTPPTKSAVYSVIRDDMHFVYYEVHLHNFC